MALPSRAFGGPIALDLLVVVDPTVYDYHGDDTQHYVTEMLREVTWFFVVIIRPIVLTLSSRDLQFCPTFHILMISWRLQ